MTDTNYPTGAALIAALIELHRETDDEDVLQLVEEEIGCAGWGLVEIATPDEHPAPDAEIEELVELHENAHRLGKDVLRYIRLRIFDELGAFEGCDRQQNDEINAFNNLTDDQLRYVESFDVDSASYLAEKKLEQRK